MAVYEKAIEGITNLISEYITDDDLIAKLNFETEKLKFELDKALLSTATSPRTDSFIKILIATRDIIIPLMRPVGSLAMASFAAYCTYKGIQIPEGIQYALFGAPLAYGASRHSGKKDEELTKRSSPIEKEKWDDI